MDPASRHRRDPGRRACALFRDRRNRWSWPLPFFPGATAMSSRPSCRIQPLRVSTASARGLPPTRVERLPRPRLVCATNAFRDRLRASEPHRLDRGAWPAVRGVSAPTRSGLLDIDSSGPTTRSATCTASAAGLDRASPDGVAGRCMLRAWADTFASGRRVLGHPLQLSALPSSRSRSKVSSPVSLSTGLARFDPEHMAVLGQERLDFR